MGIDKLFNGLVRNDIIKDNGIVIGLKKKMDANYVYIDFNSLMYGITTNVERELNYLLYSLILLLTDRIKLTDKAEKIMKKWKLNECHTLEKFVEHFDEKILNETIFDDIENSIIYIITKLLNPENINLIYIAADGIPQMSKINEQKKRKYNAYIISDIKNEIKKRHMSENNMPEKRLLYEKYKICIEKKRIQSLADFMGSSIKIFMSDNFKNMISTYAPNLNEIIVSHQRIYGEGEKKMIEHIITNKRQGKYIIYSPDSDLIILGIIAGNILDNKSSIAILKHNSNEEYYDLIDIGVLSENIFSCVKANLGKNAEIYSKIKITNDIAFLFTLFGNDFIPKLESLNARNHIETVLLLYCDCIKHNKNIDCSYLVRGEKPYRINYSMLHALIEKIADNEKELLFDTYLFHNCKNYNYLRKIFGCENLYPHLISYIRKANELFNKIRLYNDNKVTLDFVIESNDLDFLEKFILIETQINKKMEFTNINSTNVVEKLKEYILNKKTKVKGELKLYTYDNTIDTSLQLNTIIKSFPHPEIEITEYDKEIYNLERMIGSYEQKFNPKNFDLGKVNIKLSNKGNYSIDTPNIKKNIIDYYKTFFDMTHNFDKIKTKSGDTEIIKINGINTLVMEYIKGLFWTFDWYFNKNDVEYNSVHMSTWFYPYNRAPLLEQVKYALRDIGSKNSPEFYDRMDNLYNSVTSEYIKMENYMNPLEHHMYITPVNHITKFPKNFDKSELKNIFPKMTEINDFECKRISYLSKCNLNNVKFVSFNDYMNVMKKFRSQFDVPIIYPSLHLILGNKKSQNFYNHKCLIYFKNYFKHLYLATKNPEFKKYQIIMKYALKNNMINCQ